MKLDANWKVKSTPALINMLHDMTLLHFKDFKRALYDEGNYRLSGRYKKTYLITRSAWKTLGEADQGRKVVDFLKDKKSLKSNNSKYIVSTYSDFQVPALNVAKKPGQKSRPRSTKTKTLNKKVKDLRKKMMNNDI